MAIIDTEDIPELPLEKLAVEAFSKDDPGCIRSGTGVSIAQAHGCVIQPNYVFYGLGPQTADSMCLMAGDRFSELPAFRRTFLAHPEFAIVYVADRLGVTMPRDYPCIALSEWDRIHENLEVHKKLGPIAGGQPADMLFSIYALREEEGIVNSVYPADSYGFDPEEYCPGLQEQFPELYERMVKAARLEGKVSEVYQERFQVLARIHNTPYDPEVIVKAVQEFIAPL